MPARRAAAFAVMLFLGATCLRGAHVQADPHELYASAKGLLAKGDLQGADAALARLHALIASGPGWDPGGLFSKELLPPLETRLKRLQGVTHKLDEFEAQALKDLHPPNPLRDTSSVRSYTDWATTVIQRLRDERDGIVSAAHPNPDDRAVLLRTMSYARTERLLETDILKKMADAAGDDILGLLAGDPKQESVLLRFRQLKLELMQVVEERDGLKGQIAKSGERQDALLLTMAAMATDGAPPAVVSEGGSPADIKNQFDRFLDRRIAALRGRPSLSSAERAVTRSDVERYKRYKQEFAAAGIVLDPGGRIEVLAQTADGLPISDGVSTQPAGRGPPSRLPAGAPALALAVAAGVIGWLLGVRRRRAAARRPSPDDTRPGLPPEAHRADAGRDAA